MKPFLLPALLVCSLIATISAAEENATNNNGKVIVTFPLGAIEGEKRHSLHGKDFYAFEDVPYAEPPIGQRRFNEPQAVKPWRGVRRSNSTAPRKICMQLNMFTALRPPYKVEGEEDCLFLNIYTPDIRGNYDVIVFIHGGGFNFGNGPLQGPNYLLDNPVVYVNMNYRLGPLGFLSTESQLISGNMGLKDQILALKWIKQHIRHFGGNPNSITLTGMSAGGSSVHFHYMCEQSKGLFHRGVSQSGTMLNPWVLAEESKSKTLKLAEKIGCKKQKIEETVRCLREYERAEDIVDAAKYFLDILYNPFAPFGIVIDKWSKNAVLPQHPLRMIQAKRIQNLPWIASYCEAEGLFPGADFYHEDLLAEVNEKWNAVMPSILDFKYTQTKSKYNETSEKIRQHYLQDKKVNKESYLDFIKVLTDRNFVGDIIKTVKLHASILKRDNIHFYRFTYRGANSLSTSRAQTNKNFGAAHMDDSSYVLNNFIDTTTTENDRRMIEVMVKLFVSFAKNGKPDVGSVKWDVVQPDRCNRLNINSYNDLKLDVEDYANGPFWAGLDLNENERYIRRGGSREKGSDEDDSSNESD